MTDAQRKKLSEIGETVMIHLNKGNEPSGTRFG